MTIEFEYERIHKKCHHCHRLTHEKFKCPLLRNASKPAIPSISASSGKEKSSSETAPSLAKNVVAEAPPGFPPMFSELPPQEQRAALLYVSHSDDT